MILFKFAYIRCKPWLMDKRRRREDPTSPNRDSIETLGMWEKRHLLCGLYAEKTNDVLSPSIEFVHYSRVYDRSAIEPDRLPQSRAITNRGTGQQVAVCWWSWEIWMLMWLCDSGWRWNPAGKQINLVDVAASSLSSPGRGAQVFDLDLMLRCYDLLLDNDGLRLHLRLLFNDQFVGLRLRLSDVCRQRLAVDWARDWFVCAPSCRVCCAPG